MTSCRLWVLLSWTQKYFCFIFLKRSKFVLFDQNGIFDLIYIRNWSLQPFSQAYDLASPLMLCVLILYMSGWTYNLKSTPNDRFLWSFFMAILFKLKVFVRSLLRGNRRRNIFIFSFWWLTSSGLTSNKPTHYLPDYGVFNFT